MSALLSCLARARQFLRNRAFLLMVGLFILGTSGIVIYSLNSEAEEFISLGFSKDVIQKIGDRIQRWSSSSSKNTRIACLVSAASKYHNTRGKAVMETWGKRCDLIYFVADNDGKEYPFLNLILAKDVPNSYGYSWGRMIVLYKWAYKNIFDQADWFIKADDDTYLIMENLKQFLEDKNSSYPALYGRHVKTVTNKGFIAGGNGIIFSKSAFEMLVTKGLDNPNICPKGINVNEDVRTAQCAVNLGIEMINGEDETGEQFHPYEPIKTMKASDPWLRRSSYKPLKPGLACCSVNTVAFHHVQPEWMYVLEMLLYKIRVADMPVGPANDTLMINHTAVNVTV